MLVQAFPDIPSIVIEKVLDNCQFDCNEAVQCLLAGANVNYRYNILNQISFFM